MFASTNLVVELGIVLIVLIGWQFAVAEFVGGIIMIVLFTLLAGLWLRGRRVAEARIRLTTGDGEDAGHEHMHGPAENTHLQHEPWSKRLRSTSGWADASTFTMADLTMIRKELVIGYVVAGMLATLVPTHFWNTLFLQGHGFWTSLENVIVGPFIAMISFVCSVGNVPLAAALWKGGISFGGVISFIFADLIALPLLLIYRRYYGWQLMVRMLAVFWLVMSAAGLITEGLFRAAHLVPTDRSTEIVADRIQWNYTTILNIIFLAIFVLQYWTYRNRDRLGGGTGLAIDPVCGMQVRTADAPASYERDGERLYFCSDRCKETFLRDGESARVGDAVDGGSSR
jgi:YHS domain-containing protein/uncharacterized membrane protein YraQ (UPF0718 family)